MGERGPDIARSFYTTPARAAASAREELPAVGAVCCPLVEVPVIRPIALVLPLSLAALACTPVADLDDNDLQAPAADEEAPDGAATRVGPNATRCVDAKPREASELDPNDPVEQAQLRIQRGDRWLGLPLQEIRYDTVVVGTLAETTVTQVFHNPLPDRLEALYTFPLPDDAAVDDYWIRVGERHVHSVLKRRADAEKDYARAREAGKTAALLTQERPNVFTQAVANIAPGAAIEVEIHFVQPLSQKDGRYALALPTVVGPRYVSPGAVPDAARVTPPVLPAGASTCTPVDIHVAIDTTLPIGDIASKQHAVTIARHPQGAAIELAGGPVRADRDFELSWRLGGPRPRAELLAQRQGDGGHFTLTIQPPTGFDAGRSPPRELVFVVDVSGSMRGIPLLTARRAVARALAGMRQDDTFNVITFAGQADALAPAALANTAENRERAVAFLAAASHRGGGTEMLTGILAALDPPQEPGRLRMILFMTDGYIGDETRIFRALDQRRGDARLFAFGVGGSVNRFLLDGLARTGRGAATVMGPGERPDAAVDEFYARVDRPVLTDISIDWGGLKIEDASPAQLPDLFAGQPVVVYGRYTGALAGEVVLRGKLGGAAVEIPVDLARARASEHPAVAGMWARKRIDDLSGYPLHATGGELPEGRERDAVIDLALAHRVMTAWTAFVAVEEVSEKLPDGTLRIVQVPVDMPYGTGGDGGYGEGTVGLTGSGHGAGFGGRASGVPVVRQAAPEITGCLDKDLIRRVVRAHMAEVRRCYELGLTRNPNLKGRLAIAFMVDRAGAVTHAEVAESTLADPAVGTCVARLALRWKFPAGGTVNLVYPFNFEPY
jgi:Ca-activated chloride channel family protein